MADFNQTGLGDWYGELLGSAQQQLVRQPDGTYAPAPQFGGNTSLDAIYGGILPSGPATRQVTTVPVARSPSDPVGYGGDWNNLSGMVAGAWGNTPPPPVQTAGARPAITQGVQPAGTVTMPPGARPSNIPPPNMAPPPTQSATWDPFNTTNPNADQSRLPTNAGEAEFLAAFGPQAQNPALSAIDQLTGSGRSTAFPFPVPSFRRGLVPTGDTLPGATNFDGSPVEIMVNGGKQMPPMPRNRPAPPMGGNYTVKRGDTVWDLARANNTTVNAIALANGLRDPSKIRAGQQLTLPSVPAPRMPPPSLRSNKTPGGLPSGMTFDEVGAKRYHG
jgi:nucleoid-associated protein YgaU